MAVSRTRGGLPAMLMGLGGALAATAGAQPSPAPAPGARPGSGVVVGDDPDGRRDPFVRPIGADAGGPAEGRPAGLAGLAVGEAVVRGIVASREGYLAVLEAPDARSYVVRPADRLYDGRVQAITGDAVQFLLESGDAAGLAGRVSRKRIRGEESGR